MRLNRCSHDPGSRKAEVLIQYLDYQGVDYQGGRRLADAFFSSASLQASRGKLRASLSMTKASVLPRA